MNDPRIRSFIAITLPGSVRKKLAACQSDLKPMGMAASWPSPAGFHLTLAFLGDIGWDDIPGIQTVMRDSARGCPRLNLGLDTLGVFPGLRRPRVLWAGVADRGQDLNCLYLKLRQGLGTVGMPKPKKRLIPHITLARFKRPPRPDLVRDILDRDPGWGSAGFKVGGLFLFQSELTRSGAVHTPLFKVGLSGE